jgi:hypothetical protein
VAEDGVARAGVLLKRSDKEQVGRWTERGKDKWTAGDNREQCQQGDGEKAIDEDVEGPDHAGRKVVEEPGQTKTAQQHGNVLRSSTTADDVRFGQRISFAGSDVG